jgi:hypothetical protein
MVEVAATAAAAVVVVVVTAAAAATNTISTTAVAFKKIFHKKNSLLSHKNTDSQKLWCAFFSV